MQSYSMRTQTLGERDGRLCCTPLSYVRKHVNALTTWCPLWSERPFYSGEIHGNAGPTAALTIMDRHAVLSWPFQRSHIWKLKYCHNFIQTSSVLKFFVILSLSIPSPSVWYFLFSPWSETLTAAVNLQLLISVHVPRAHHESGRASHDGAPSESPPLTSAPWLPGIAGA